MRMGKYEFQDWHEEIVGTKPVWYRVIKDLAKDTDNDPLYEIFVFESSRYKAWTIGMDLHKLSEIYYDMFDDAYPMFNTPEEGKAHVDLFLNKLVKLKMFL